eukprot:4262173-Amphidinium_carterae.1
MGPSFRKIKLVSCHDPLRRFLICCVEGGNSGVWNAATAVPGLPERGPSWSAVRRPLPHILDDSSDAPQTNHIPDDQMIFFLLPSSLGNFITIDLPGKQSPTGTNSIAVAKNTDMMLTRLLATPSRSTQIGHPKGTSASFFEKSLLPQKSWNVRE